MILFALALVAFPITTEFVRPEFNARLRWKEVFESGLNQSGPEIFVRAGIFPRFEKILTGLELSTRALNQDQSVLNNYFESKEIGLSQAYLGFQIDSAFSIEGLSVMLLAGKFSSPSMSSPIIYNSDIRPEGFFENLRFEFSSGRLLIAATAAQYSLDQTAENHFLSERQRRSWIFQQGIMARRQINLETSVESSIFAYLFFRPSDRVRAIGVLRGNSSTQRNYRPIEANLRFEAKPLSLFASLAASFVWNPSTEDDQRGFWVQSSIGKKWRRDNFSFDVSYVYSEPDVTMAALSEETLGFLNRKGPQIGLHYFPFDYLRTGVSYAHLATLSSSVNQRDRQDLRGELELKF